MKMALFVLMLTCANLPAQVRPPAARPPVEDQTGKASIEGTVLDAITHEPIKKASVALNGRAYLSAVTDAFGHFAFRELPAGQYMIRANSTDYPAPRPGIESEQETSVSLAAEQKREIELSLTPGASLRGHIVDEDGSPMPRCMVRAMQFQDSEQGRTLAGIGFAQSDDTGEYRISTIPPGKYFIMAGCAQAVPLPHAFVRRSAAVDLPVLSYPPQFYPGVPDPAGAARVEASPGANIAGIDLRMVPAAAVIVRGHVSPLPSDRSFQIALESKDSSRREWQQKGAGVNPSTGEFRIPNVLPGSYELVASGSESGRSYFAKVSVEVGATSPDPVDVRLSVVPAISGTIVVDGKVSTPMNTMRVMMNPLDRRPMTGGPPPQAEVQSDGTFTLSSVGPGRWRLSVNGSPGYVKSVTKGDQEVSPSDLEIAPDAPATLKVVIGTDFGQIEATITAPPSGPNQVFAILWPANGDPTLRQNIAFSPEGRANFRVPPGRYHACAVSVTQPGMLLQNQGLRTALESRCDGVDVAEGGRKSVQTQFISTPDLKQLL